jgi:hypothetical protein
VALQLHEANQGDMELAAQRCVGSSVSGHLSIGIRQGQEKGWHPPISHCFQPAAAARQQASRITVQAQQAGSAGAVREHSVWVVVHRCCDLC